MAKIGDAAHHALSVIFDNPNFISVLVSIDVRNLG